jgi:hypothetical protein
MVDWQARNGGTVQLHGPAIRRERSRSGPKVSARQGGDPCLSMPTHVLMATGGDIRLRTDPETLLNGYGCSHRPRPWAITFASSTASSVSERGYMAADAARLRANRAALAEHDERTSIKTCLEEVREELARLLQLEFGTEIVLSASGTDAELLALALTHIGGNADAPICNILVGPEETGRGVPLAARGFHFAVDTALQEQVTPGTLIAGFRPDTRLCSIAVRDSDAQLKPIEAIEADIRDAVKKAMARGERVLLHALDLSKTGLMAPRPSLLGELRRIYGCKFDIVVDACQTRLSPSSIGRYLALGAVVLITGSKFFTGPPFSGAALIPRAIAGRLAIRKLPSGLNDYFSQDDFFSGGRAASMCRSAGNIGLALRWHAALAEMGAFFAVPVENRLAILERFGETVRAAISARPLLTLIPIPQLFRDVGEEAWERTTTIFPFVVSDPQSCHRYLEFEKALSLYRWLNSDISEILPHERLLASKICHIGQPVSLANSVGGKPFGALRISAGARLVSGELSHAHLSNSERLERELQDVKTVFEKIDLVLRNWRLVEEADPKPHYDTICVSTEQFSNFPGASQMACDAPQLCSSRA